jgi:comEA protein
MFGLTKQEQGIVLFLIFTLLVGSTVTLYQRFVSGGSVPDANQIATEEFKKRAEEINYDEDSRYGELNNSIEEPSADSNAIKRNHDHTVNLQKNNSSRKGDTHPLNNTKESKFLININQANQEELQKLPRIGPVLAKRIVTYREKNGQFNTVEDLKAVKGIGTATLAKIGQYITLK